MRCTSSKWPHLAHAAMLGVALTCAPAQHSLCAQSAEVNGPAKPAQPTKPGQPTKPARSVKPKAAEQQPSAAESPLTAEEAAGHPVSPPELKINPRTLATLDLPIAENLPKIDGGAIPRVALSAELQRGIGAFLRQVRTKPAVQNGRFVGWRLIELFKKRPDVHVNGLRAGDTVVKVNGKSLERPEQFKVVWDSLASAQELVLEIERQGRRCQLRYAIV